MIIHEYETGQMGKFSLSIHQKMNALDFRNNVANHKSWFLIALPFLTRFFFKCNIKKKKTDKWALSLNGADRSNNLLNEILVKKTYIFRKCNCVCLESVIITPNLCIMSMMRSTDSTSREVSVSRSWSGTTGGSN